MVIPFHHSPMIVVVTPLPAFLLVLVGALMGGLAAVLLLRRKPAAVAGDPPSLAPGSPTKRDNEHLLQQLLEQADCLIWQSGVRREPDGSVVWFDTFFPRSALDRRLYGQRDPSRPGIWDRDRVPDLPEMDQRSTAALRTGAPSYEQEFRFCRDDQVYCLHEYVTITRLAEDRWSLVGVVTDVTERHRLRAELQRASKLESVGVLAGGIAHDFNNVLTAIMGNLTLAALDAEDIPSARQALEESERACLRARELTQELLTFARGGDPIRTPVDLREIVRGSASIALHGAPVQCQFEFGPDLWPAHVDRGQIAQVVRGLVTNAVQAMPSGGRIQIAARNEPIRAGGAPLQPGDYVRLTVTDDGPGIPAENLSKIFDPYFTTKAQGSGLGLATVYSIVRRHRGHVAVESEPGRGARFDIWLPVVRQRVTEPAAPKAADTPSLRGRALVLDDEAPVRMLVAKFAQHLGLEVATAADGETAVTLCREAWEKGEPFDLVVFDLTIPGGVGGREALETIRRFQPEVRAIVSSGYSHDPVMGNAQAHGFHGVVAKPYSLQEFERTVRAVLGDGRADSP